MRYIYYIILIFLALSCALGYELLSSPARSRDTALIINGQVITRSEFDRLCPATRQTMNTEDDSVNSLITRELLIQEAEKEGIDKEEPFRRSIQNFYEQSLIKLLMDKKMRSLKVSVGSAEVDRYTSFIGKKVLLTIFTSDSMQDAEEGRYKKEETKEMNFDDLSGDIKAGVFLLKEGATTGPVREGEKFIVLRLDKVERTVKASQQDRTKGRDNIREMLVEEKREREMSDWIAGLRKRASVKIMRNREN